MKKEHAIEHFGSQRKVAEALDITESAVSRWPEIVPFQRAVSIQSITDGKLMVNVADYQKASA